MQLELVTGCDVLTESLSSSVPSGSSEFDAFVTLYESGSDSSSIGVGTYLSSDDSESMISSSVPGSAYCGLPELSSASLRSMTFSRNLHLLSSVPYVTVTAGCLGGCTSHVVLVTVACSFSLGAPGL